jgi:AraC family carnitine catabolism transcriptional activator
VQFGLLSRLQHARALLIGTKKTIREIAIASGFNTLSHFGGAFRLCFGGVPSQYREAWPKNDASPHWPGTLTKYFDARQQSALQTIPRDRERR